MIIRSLYDENSVITGGCAAQPWHCMPRRFISDRQLICILVCRVFLRHFHSADFCPVPFYLPVSEPEVRKITAQVLFTASAAAGAVLLNPAITVADWNADLSRTADCAASDCVKTDAGLH